MADHLRAIPLQEAAKLLGKHRTTLYRWVREGRVPYHITPGGTPYFTAADIEAYHEANARPAVA